MKWWWKFTLQNCCFRLSENSGHIFKVILQFSDYFSFPFYTAVRPCCKAVTAHLCLFFHHLYVIKSFRCLISIWKPLKKCFGAVIKMLLACIPQWHWLNSYTMHVFEGRQEIGKQIRICFLPSLSSPLLPWGSLSVWSWRKLLCTC